MGWGSSCVYNLGNRLCGKRGRRRKEGLLKMGDDP